jgi:hypothetical protein
LEISDNTAKSAHEFKDALKQVEDGTSGFGNMIVTWMLPALTGWAKEFATLFERGQAINLILRFVSEALRMVWIVVLNVVDAIQTFVKVIADAVAGLFVFFTALKEGGWKQAKAALAEIGNQIRTDVKDSFKNLSGEVEKSGKALDEHQKKMVKVALTAGQLKKAFDEVKKEFEAAHPGMASYFNEMDKLAKKTAGTLQDQLFGGITAVAGGIQKGLGTALSDLAMGTESLGTAITKMGDSILRSLVDYVAQLLAAKVAQAALGAAGKANLGASTAASVAAGATVATAWASAAALTSLASFGANAAPAQAGLVSTATLAQALGALASGSDMIGQTGAYILHKDEGVVHPKANKKLTEFLDKNSGGNGSGGGPVTLEIHFSDRKMASYLLDLNRKGLIKLAVP